MLKHHEFWHPRVFEIPYYLTLIAGCLLKGMSIKTLAKANYSLDHGEIGIGSKFQSQMYFDQRCFPRTMLLQHDLSPKAKQQRIEAFASRVGFPFILKPDGGHLGKGVLKISAPPEIARHLPQLLGNYIVQAYCPYSLECGIFYVRCGGRPRITGINIKHFPTVIGNGRDSLGLLVRKHPRYNRHWASFLHNLDLERIPAGDEEVCLSFIGSHTLGCRFTDDSHLLTEALEQAVFRLFEYHPGFNFGRLDVKAESQQALQAGVFIVIEVNGVASLPTHMFDPSYSVLKAYRIFLRHAWLLVQCANEHRHQPMELLPMRQLIQRVRVSEKLLQREHDALMQ